MGQVPVVHTCSLPVIPQRPANGHKGTFGRVLVFGGSVGFSGAVCLASVAALRSGSGLVTAAVPQSIQALVAGYEPSVMTRGLPEDQQQLQRIPRDVLQGMLQGIHAVCCGPGLGQTSAVAGLVEELLSAAECPVVLDADALNVAAQQSLLQRPRRSACVITPHPGEFARLTGQAIPNTSPERDRQAIDFAESTKTIVVLKGPGTVVTDGRRIYRNATGNSGMATGGSGDVLAGMVASLLGQAIPAFEAAAIAVHAHGLAGDFAAEQFTERGMIASDLLRFLPHAWRALGG